MEVLKTFHRSWENKSKIVRESITKCKKPSDYIKWFSEVGIANDNWHDGRWIYKNFQGIYAVIVKKWGTYKNFLTFMKVKSKPKNLKQKFDACNSRKDFIKLFEEEGISHSDWQRSYKLARKHPNVHSAVYSSKRFGDWGKFAEFMQIEKDKTWSEKLSESKTTKEITLLLKKEKVPIEKLCEVGWLYENGFRTLCSAITKDPRWKSVHEFATSLSILGRNWSVIIEQCRTPKDILNLFKKLKISRNIWQEGSLRNAGFHGLQVALSRRFGNQIEFKKFMGMSVEESESLASRVRVMSKREEILRLFSNLEIPKEIWSNSHKLGIRNSGLVQAIFRHPLFCYDWSAFIKFMDFDEINAEQEFEKLSLLNLEESMALRTFRI